MAHEVGKGLKSVHAMGVSKICPQGPSEAAEVSFHGNCLGLAGLCKPQPKLHENHHHEW